MENRKTVLVTGGAGFIGSHLCEELLKRGNTVISIDNFNDYYDPSYKKYNISEIYKTLKEREVPRENFTSIKGDIRDKKILDEIFKNDKIDVVAHLAACAGVRPSIVDPVLYYDVNIMGTINVLETVRKHGVKQFVFASSSSVYGNNEKTPFSEEDKVDNPISPYAASKKSGELICHTYHHLYDISVACLRFFTVYGPRQRPDLAIRKFTELLLKDEEIPVYGDGSSERDYTYIRDIIDGVMNAIEWVDACNPRYYVFNLGNSQTVSLSQMIETIEKVVGRKFKIKRLPEQPGDVKRTYADIRKSNRHLGYSPKVKFEQGVSLFYDWLVR